LPQQARGLEQNRDGRRIVVGAGSRRDGVVVGPQDNNLLAAVPTRPLDDHVACLLIPDVIPLPYDRVAEILELALGIGGGSLQGGRFPEVPWADETGQPIDVRFQSLAQLTPVRTVW
jgi:hypothetical protein